MADGVVVAAPTMQGSGFEANELTISVGTLEGARALAGQLSVAAHGS